MLKRKICKSESENERKQEWQRRRKLRLEQVRKQNHSIAKEIREQVEDENAERVIEFDVQQELELKKWKIRKLSELERKYRNAVGEIGTGHKQARVEPDPEEVKTQISKLNFMKAADRGKLAEWEEKKETKVAEEIKRSQNCRRLLTRKIEGIRSALICAVPVQMSLPRVTVEGTLKLPSNNLNRNIFSDSFAKPVQGPLNAAKNENKTANVPFIRSATKSLYRNKITEDLNKQNTGRNMQEFKQERRFLLPSTDVDDIRGFSTAGTGSRSACQDGNDLVEFYDYSSRYYCKTYRKYRDLVERINPDTEPDAREIARIDEDNMPPEVQDKAAFAGKRGKEALAKAKIRREYDVLINRLARLSKEERMLKSSHHIIPADVHLSDDRRLEKFEKKQGGMETKFEDVFRNQKERRFSSLEHRNLEYSDGRDEPTPVLNVAHTLDSKERKLPTSTIPSASEPSHRTLVKQNSLREPEEEADLLSDIARTLQNGRRLREAASLNTVITQKSSDAALNLVSDEKEAKEEERREVVTKEVLSEPGYPQSPRREENKSIISESLQMEDARWPNASHQASNKRSDKSVDDSLPLSASTCYKSPPEEIRIRRTTQLLNHFGATNEGSKNNRSDEGLGMDMERLLMELNHMPESEVQNHHMQPDPYLSYYIIKLLAMTRESVSQLDISNVSDFSLPDMSGLRDVKDETDERRRTEDVIRSSRLRTAHNLEKNIQHWREILDRSDSQFDGHCRMSEEIPATRKRSQTQRDTKDTEVSFNNRPESKALNVEDRIPSSFGIRTDMAGTSDLRLLDSSSRIDHKLNEKSEKCSQRILELSRLLEQIRKNKNKSSSTDSINSSQTEKSPEKVEPSKSLQRPDMKSSRHKPPPALQDFTKRYQLSPDKSHHLSTIHEMDYQTARCGDSMESDSSESIPNIMEELLRRRIISSPFQWTEPSHTSGYGVHRDSIRSAVTDFRSKVTRMEPFSNTPSPPGPSLENEDVPDSPRTIEAMFRPLLLCSSKSNEMPCVKKNDGADEILFDGINRTLSDLGLKWATAFFKKNEESKAFSTSSNSEPWKSPASEKQLHFKHKNCSNLK